MDDSTSEKFKIMLHDALGRLSVRDPQSPLLVQFWARAGAGKEVFLLATTNQPYGVYGHDKKLDLFHESCLQQKLFIDLDTDKSFGLPGLVFKTETRQQTQNMNFYNPEDVRPQFGSNAIFPVQWGSFAVPVFLYTEGVNKTPSTCSTAKKKECVGVLEFITTKSMASYDADVDLVEEALARAGFPSSARIDSTIQDSSKKDAPTETTEEKRSAEIDSSTQTTIDAPTDPASSNKKQHKTQKRKLEHTAQIDTSTEATSSKKKGRETQRIKYSSYSCVALFFGLDKREAMKRIGFLLGLKKPVKESTFNSVLREIGITKWPNIRKKATTSASTSSLPETLTNLKAAEITLINTTWDDEMMVRELHTSSGSYNMHYLVEAPANETPNLAISNETLYIPTAPEVPTGTRLAENALMIHDTNNRHLGRDFNVLENKNVNVLLPGVEHTEDQVVTDRVGAQVNKTSYFASSFETPNATWDDEIMARELRTGFGNSSMQYLVGAPANETPNLAISNETLIITAPELPIGLQPAENAYLIRNTNKRHIGRYFDVLENQNNYAQLPGIKLTEDQVMPVGTPLNKTSSFASSYETPNSILDAMAQELLRSPARIIPDEVSDYSNNDSDEIILDELFT